MKNIYVEGELAEEATIRKNRIVQKEGNREVSRVVLFYNQQTKITKDLFKTFQNKLHFAIHGSTAAEVIYNRADRTREHMGLTSWKNAPLGKIVKMFCKKLKTKAMSDELLKIL